MAYVDTSALLKWYLPERGSERFADWAAQQSDIEISRLTCIEIRCALGRRQRAGTLSSESAGQALQQFQSDLHEGLFTLHGMRDDIFLIAEEMVAASAHGLRTLDALHLALAKVRKTASFVTADQTLSEAAIDAGFYTILI
jgi:predicted nucleic acid-binding protein